MADDSSKIEMIVQQYVEHIKHQMQSRSYRVANEMRNESQKVLRGQRSGRRYRVPNTKAYYTASAPGEPPAVRTGTFRRSWQAKSYADGDNVHSVIESNATTENGKYLLGEMLEEGTSKMAPRPYKQRILEKARQQAMRIYKEPYF